MSVVCGQGAAVDGRERLAVSFVIPTYNRAELLRQTLRSVLDLLDTGAVEAEVLVIDNNCTDSTADVVAEASQGSTWPVRHIVERQQGASHCRNRGIVEAAFPYLAYLDDDVVLAASWIEGLIDGVTRLEADFIVGPVDPLYQVQPPSFLSAKALDSVTSAYSRKGDEPMTLSLDLAREVPGCNFSVARHVARGVGGFDTGLDRVGGGMMAGGDSELGYRVGKAGYRMIYHPACRIQHVISASKLTRSAMRRRWYGLGATERALDSRLNKAFRLKPSLRRACRAALRFPISRGAEAFQHQLVLLRELGYLLGRSEPG